jgi:small-conductance mechanosensitive channel
MQAESIMTSWQGLLMAGIILGLVLIFAFVLVLVLLNFSQRRRELEHEERMKARQMDQPIPERHPEWPQAMICIAIGAGVPIAAFLFTALATLSQKVDSGIFWAPGIVGIAAVYYGYCLATQLISGSNPDQEEEAEDTGKPAIDADAIDVVGQRGG